jgi:CubicO group peptidase (beta-lactamase class C family)
MLRLDRRQLLKGALAWTAGAAITQAQAGGDVPERERVAMRRIANAFREKYGVPGLSVAIAHRGRLAYEEAFGQADAERGEVLTPAHCFRIASVSKPITACAVFDLVEAGRLSLDTRVFGRGAVLGTRFGRTPYGRGIEAITIEHLLTHTAGGWRNDGGDPMFQRPRLDHAELISWTLDSAPLQNRPGQAYAYSNFGYCILGRVIEAVTGRGYAEHVQQRLLDRCGVRSMAIAGDTLADRQPSEVRYHGRAGDDPYRMNVRRMDAHGGWLASARDLVLFAVHVDGFATTPDVLRPATITRMTTASTANPGYAKGWSVNRAGNWWHGGSLPGTSSILVRTSGRLCWAALANTRSSGMNLDPLMWEMAGQVKAWGA